MGWLGGWKSADGSVTTVHAYGMPTVLIQAPRFRDRGPSVDQFELAWKVPVDDEWHMRFTVYPTLEAGDHTRGDENAWRRMGARNDGWTDRILSGELTVEEAEAAALEAQEGLGFQDSVSQNGQGRVWLRKGEHLGRSDVDVIMRRKMWERDISAFLRGDGVRQWERPDWLNINNWQEVVAHYKDDSNNA
jgi:5,5'-dehydrodivanillate O-demethylase oxygenase subunit